MAWNRRESPKGTRESAKDEKDDPCTSRTRRELQFLADCTGVRAAPQLCGCRLDGCAVATGRPRAVRGPWMMAAVVVVVTRTMQRCSAQAAHGGG